MAQRIRPVKKIPFVPLVAVIIGLVLLIVMVAPLLSRQASPAATTAYTFGLIGNDGNYLLQERNAGITLKLFSLSWRQLIPDEGVIDQTYLQEKHSELTALQEAGFDVILSFGLHDTPDWIHENYDNSYFINQFGERYNPDEHDAGTANFVFNAQLRLIAAQYIETVFILFGNNFYAVRVGGGRYGELTYPPAQYNDSDNNYWAFDENALAQMPVTEWLPGDHSPDNEAQRFLTWYLDALTVYQNWQITQVRQHFAGDIMVLYPSWGIRPGDIEAAIATNLNGSSAAERNGEIQRGFAFDQQIAAIDDPLVVVTTTWLDADATQDNGSDPRYWSPVKYLSTLADNHPLALRKFGENTGQGTVEDMALSVAQMQTYGLYGMLWYRETELFSGEYATLADYVHFMETVQR